MAESRAIGSICANCLSRIRISSSAPTNQISGVRTFHSTTAALNVVKKKGTPNAAARSFGLREQRSAQFKKKPRERPSVPPVGERKALRKRIVLSNTNALPVESMQDLSNENIADAELIGKMVGLPGDVIDQLRAVDAFKPSQKNWAMFRRPATLARKETIQLGEMIKSVDASGEGEGKVIRSIIDGPKSSGKSLMLLQAMSMAFLNKWIVINIPEAQDLTIAHSSYRPLPPTQDGQQLYTQPDLTATLLKRIAESNREVLSTLTLAHSHPDFPEPLQSNISLDRLADRGASNPPEAPTIFSALWKELTVPSPNPDSQPRPPLLISIDGLNQLMTTTAYRAADFSPIHAHQFTLIQHFLSLLFAQQGTNTPTLGPAGCIILAATTGSNAPANYTLDISLSQLAAASRPARISPSSPDFPLPEPYRKLDPRVLDLFSPNIQSSAESGLQYQRVEGLSKAEARGLLEYFARSGLLREKITDEVVSEKWSLSGGGIVGYVERAAGRVRVRVGA